MEDPTVLCVYNLYKLEVDVFMYQYFQNLSLIIFFQNVLNQTIEIKRRKEIERSWVIKQSEQVPPDGIQLDKVHKLLSVK